MTPYRLYGNPINSSGVIPGTSEWYMAQNKAATDSVAWNSFFSDGKREINPTSTTYTEVVWIWSAHAILTLMYSNVGTLGFAVLIFFKQ